MAEGEGISENLKQAVRKVKQPTQAYGVSVSPGSSSLPKSPVPNAELTPGRSPSLPKSPVPIAELTPGRSPSLRKSLLPIAELTPEPTIFNWEIQGLVVCKSEVKRYTNGDGNYFSFEMRDEAGGEIRVVCFDSEVDRFFTKVVEGKEHVLTRGKLITPKEKFNRMNRRCEIVLEYDSEIQVLQEEEEDENNNNSLLERVAAINKVLEFCTSKLQELEIEIKKGKIGNPAAGTSAVVKMEAPGEVGVSENRYSQAEKKIESPVIRKNKQRQQHYERCWTWNEL